MRNLSESADNPDPRFCTGPSAEPVYRGYDQAGVEGDHEASGCVAKSCTDPISGNARYWVRRGATGAGAGLLYDPHSVYAATGSSPENAYARAGHPSYLWRPATRECFEQYLLYLRTKNPIHLRHAERL
jgi:hypothetical protein